jgi:hypothetical protein
MRTYGLVGQNFTPGVVLFICYVVHRNVANMSINSPAMVALQQKMTEARYQTKVLTNMFLCLTAVFRIRDPDPYPGWIRIQSSQWIRIWLQIRDTDPDPGGQK